MSSYNTTDRTHGKKALKLKELTNGEFTIITDFCKDNDFLGHYNLLCSLVEENKMEEGWLFGHHKVVRISVLEGLKSLVEESQGELDKIKKALG
jgi:hypothetical protein